MLRHQNCSDKSAPGPLEPGERLVAPPWRLIVWGPGQPLAGGPVALSDRYLRFTPTWSGLEVTLHGVSGSFSSQTLCIPRAELLQVSWERAMFFLRNLRVDGAGGRVLHLLGGQESLRQLAAALGVSA
ncbi:MAG: hypothetical protein RMJ98_20705 [Myxococcales bacterium]|nr:hypothetical protein [Polyangiaceae bacterium]MDW8251724.1 hypothetical protein [Myxococcales bacterium]